MTQGDALTAAITDQERVVEQLRASLDVALVTVPVARHSKTPTLAEWHDPRSSALMMTSLSCAL